VAKALHIVLAAFVVVFVLVPVASAEQIFKCAGKYGSDLYQNFPCESRSPSSTTVGAQRADASPAGDFTPPATQPSSKARSKTGPAVGMTREDVKALWGPAPNAYYSELVDGRAEIWSYGPSRSVTFDAAGRVSDVQP